MYPYNEERARQIGVGNPDPILAAISGASFAEFVALDMEHRRRQQEKAASENKHQHTIYTERSTNLSKSSASLPRNLGTFFTLVILISPICAIPVLALYDWAAKQISDINKQKVWLPNSNRVSTPINPTKQQTHLILYNNQRVSSSEPRKPVYSADVSFNKVSGTTCPKENDICICKLDSFRTDFLVTNTNTKQRLLNNLDLFHASDRLALTMRSELSTNGSTTGTWEARNKMCQGTFTATLTPQPFR